MVVLVGYASEHGSTREIAERIAARLGRAPGARVEVRALAEVADAARYDAFVLGSAVHNQAWLPAATQFVRRHGDVLAGRPVWLFSVGMPAALRRPLRRAAGAEAPKVIARSAAALQGREHRLFSGVIRPEHIPFAGRLLFRASCRGYGDYRNWDEIDAWAEYIARGIARATARTLRSAGLAGRRNHQPKAAEH